MAQREDALKPGFVVIRATPTKIIYDHAKIYVEVDLATDADEYTGKYDVQLSIDSFSERDADALVEAIRVVLGIEGKVL